MQGPWTWPLVEPETTESTRAGVCSQMALPVAQRAGGKHQVPVEGAGRFGQGLMGPQTLKKVAGVIQTYFAVGLVSDLIRSGERNG